jgi:hypothetical protein
VHHPFLLPSYAGDGRFYHKSFAAIEFTPAQAGDVSFVELLHLPTSGTSSLKPKDLKPDHLRRLNDAIWHGRAQFIFIPGMVGRLMKASGYFPWLPHKPTSEEQPLRIWKKTESRTFYWHYHFSVYGKYNAEKQKQLLAIAAIARRKS